MRRAPVPTVTVSAEITSIAVLDVPESGSTTGAGRDDRRSVKGGVYRVSPDGVWDQVWESREDLPYDVAFEPNGSPIIATGTKGKLYRLEGDPLRPTLLTRAAAQQVTAFYKDARGRLYFATANPGKLFRLSSERAPRGTYESEPRDAQMVATWGALRWRGSVPKGTQLELFTRSGNTETPDEAWSTWAPASGSGESSPITSPKARYIQWRAVLTGKGDGPILTSVDGRLSPAQSASDRSLDHRPPAGHRLSEALLDRGTGSRGIWRSDDSRTQGRPPPRRHLRARQARRHWGDVRIRRTSRRLSGGPTMRTTTS